MKVLSVLLLFVTLCTTAQIPQNVMNGYFPGRSGDVLIYDKELGREQSFIVTFGDDINLPFEIKETEVAQLLTQALSLPTLNPGSDTHFDIQTNFFQKPAANVIIIMESIADTLNIARGKSKTAINMESYPYASLSHATNMVTGTTPSSHGIIANKWLDRSSVRPVYAYSSWNPTVSGSSSPNVQDALSLTTLGQSLIFSASACKGMARSMGAKAFMNQENDNNFGMYWQGSAFDSIYEDKIPSILLTRSSIVASHVTDGTIEVEDNFYYFTVDGYRVGFDMKKDFDLLAELSLVEIFAGKIGKDMFHQQVKDNVQDFYSFTFSSISNIEERYGDQSYQYKVAMNLINVAVEKLFAALDEEYNGNVMKQLIAISGVPSEGLYEEEMKHNLARVVEQDHRPLYNVESFFPELYLNFDVEIRDEICIDVENALAEYDVEVECMPEANVRFNGALRNELEASSEGNDDTATFQIALWVTVGLFFASFGASFAMLTVDASTDSLLYSQDINHPNPHSALLT